jgi:hypothetical protein
MIFWWPIFQLFKFGYSRIGLVFFCCYGSFVIPIFSLFFIWIAHADPEPDAVK